MFAEPSPETLAALLRRPHTKQPTRAPAEHLGEIHLLGVGRRDVEVAGDAGAHQVGVFVGAPAQVRGEQRHLPQSCGAPIGPHHCRLHQAIRLSTRR